MENELRRILITEQTSVAITKIVYIINTEKAKTKQAYTALAFFVVVFIGWYCIHVSVNHNKYKQESCAEKDSIINYQKIAIGIQSQYLDSAIYFKNL